MNSPKDSGPAFPGTENHGPNAGMPGMTLRQYYAAKAMQGELAAMCCTDNCSKSGLDLSVTDESLGRLTRHWFRIADAMTRAGAQEVKPKIVTDEMVHAALREMHPGLYSKHLRDPNNGPALSAVVENQIGAVRKMLEAALEV